MFNHHYFVKKKIKFKLYLSFRIALLFPPISLKYSLTKLKCLAL
uniref:Uncharacterized protein n=1 Tax=Lepeophtheirus salmonis TaxID=72036 RepID=A0A0K2UUM7_LEPSM